MVGAFPNENEILISETFATEIIADSSSSSTYSDLIDTNYEGMKISGVYNSLNRTEVDEVITGTSLNSKEEDNLLFINNIKDSDLQLLQDSNFSYWTSESFNSFNYGLILRILVYVLSNVLVYVSLKREVSKFIFICKRNKINFVIYQMNILLVYIILLTFNLFI